jgi:hypothetical protein
MKKIIIAICLIGLFSSCYKKGFENELNTNPYDPDYQPEKIAEIEEVGVTRWYIDSNGDTATGRVYVKLKLNPKYFFENDFGIPKNIKLGYNYFHNNQIKDYIISKDSIIFLEYHYYLKGKDNKALLTITRELTDNSIVDQSEKIYRIN